MRQTNLDLDALRSFVTGVELGAYARAADRLGCRFPRGIDPRFSLRTDPGGFMV